MSITNVSVFRNSARDNIDNHSKTLRLVEYIFDQFEVLMS